MTSKPASAVCNQSFSFFLLEWTRSSTCSLSIWNQQVIELWWNKDQFWLLATMPVCRYQNQAFQTEICNMQRTPAFLKCRYEEAPGVLPWHANLPYTDSTTGVRIPRLQTTTCLHSSIRALFTPHKRTCPTRSATAGSVWCGIAIWNNELTTKVASKRSGRYVCKQQRAEEQKYIKIVFRSICKEFTWKSPTPFFTRQKSNAPNSNMGWASS